MTKRLEVYQAIVAMAVDGVCEAEQWEIAARAGVRRQHIIPILRYLEKTRMIEIVKIRHRGPGARQRYIPLSPQNRTQSGPLSPQNRTQSNLTESAKPDSVTSLSPQNRTQSQKNGHMIHDHDMNDKNPVKEILNQLDFINAKNRAACAKLVDLDTARRWRQLWEYCEANDAWGEYGVKTNGVGYIVRLIKNQDPVPEPVQSPLPAGSLDLSQSFISRGMSLEQIQALQGYDGATVGPDGVVR